MNVNWIDKFQVFLFDFDGLLVNTEHLHFEAYLKMCKDRGYVLDWSFARFLEIAHLSSEGLKNEIYKRFPKLLQEEPDWKVLYEEKKAAYMHLLGQGSLQLLPGVKEVLEALKQKGIKRAVVTNSTKAQTELIKKALPVLATIPLWITREDYKAPKPDPECYRKAIEWLVEKGDSAIGFEDSTRGIQALLGAGVKNVVLICPPDHPQLEHEALPDVPYFTSFEEIEKL